MPEFNPYISQNGSTPNNSQQNQNIFPSQNSIPYGSQNQYNSSILSLLQSNLMMSTLENEVMKMGLKMNGDAQPNK